MAPIKLAAARRFNEEVVREVLRLCGSSAGIKRERVEAARLEGASVAEVAREETDRIMFPDKKVDSL